MTQQATVYGFNVTRFTPWGREVLFCTPHQTVEVIPSRWVRAGSQEWREWENEVEATRQANPKLSSLDQQFLAMEKLNTELLAALKLAAIRLESGNEVDQACARHCRTAIAKAEQQP